MNDYIASIDAGTGGVRCVLHDRAGNAVGSAYRELPTAYTPDGRAEQDPVRLIDSAFDAVRGALAQSGVDPEAVRGVTATGTQTTFVPVDARGRFLTPLILWQDARGTAMFPWIRERLRDAGLTEADLYRRTLKPLDALLEGAKLLWLRERAPALYGQIRRVVNHQGVLLRALGAEADTLDTTDGGWWLMHDGATLRRDEALADLFGLDPGMVPGLRSPGARVGEVSRTAAGRTGLRRGTPIFQGAVDQCCAALAAGNWGASDVATLCLGTAGVVMTWSHAPRPDPSCRYYVIRYPAGGFASECAVPVAASAFRWARDMLYPAGTRDGDLYARMDAEAATAPVGAGGLAFIPLLAGSIYPAANGDIRGGWVGASLSTTRADLIRAALEGVCFEMRQVLEACGGGYGAIRLLGGAARSGLWNQMQADVYGCPVETVEAGEASALGASMIAAAGAGLYGSLPEAVRGMFRVKARYEPNAALAERYARAYRAWLSCVEDLSARAYGQLAALRGEA